jgi:hypothetical protein
MYGDMALKFAEHFLWIAAAMDRIGDNEDELWDEGDGFFYDVLRFPDGSAQRLKVRSMVGLLSLCATTVIEPTCTRFPQLGERLRLPGAARGSVGDDRADHAGGASATAACWPCSARRNCAASCATCSTRTSSSAHRHPRAVAPPLEHPFTFEWGGVVGRQLQAAESSLGLFGGNSNWRGPVWMPVNVRPCAPSRSSARSMATTSASNARPARARCSPCSR